MVAGPVGRIGGVARRGIVAGRRALVTPGDAAARELAKEVENAGKDWTVNELWLKSLVTKHSSESRRELHELRMETFKMEMEFNTLQSKIRDREAARTVEVMSWLAVAIGCFGIYGMHFLYK